jgi:hypothetical protein
MKLIKIETESCIEILWWKSPNKSHLIEFISQFSELRCGRNFFLSEFCCWKFKKIAKKWVWKEK